MSRCVIHIRLAVYGRPQLSASDTAEGADEAASNAEPAKPNPSPSGQPIAVGEDGGEPTPNTPGIEEPVATPEPPQTLSARNVKIDFHKPWLASEQDVEQYLEEYRKSLLAAIKDGKHIQL